MHAANCLQGRQNVGPDSIDRIISHLYLPIESGVFQSNFSFEEALFMYLFNMKSVHEVYV